MNHEGLTTAGGIQELSFAEIDEVNGAWVANAAGAALGAVGGAVTGYVSSGGSVGGAVAGGCRWSRRRRTKPDFRSDFSSAGDYHSLRASRRRCSGGRSLSPEPRLVQNIGSSDACCFCRDFCSWPTNSVGYSRPRIASAELVACNWRYFYGAFLYRRRSKYRLSENIVDANIPFSLLLCDFFFPCFVERGIAFLLENRDARYEYCGCMHYIHYRFGTLSK